jgi:hypothetical protein
MEDEADDVFKARIFENNGKNYLAMLEGVYQATSKENRRGISFTTGYYVSRLSVYDIDDGSLSARKKLGKQVKNPTEFLGFTHGKLWFYSFDNGIHSLNPETLETDISQDSIFKINPGLRDYLAVCEWYQLQNFFQFNDITGNIILSDREGYRYILDTGTLKASLIDWEYNDFKPDESGYLKSYISIPDPGLSISGDLRRRIKVRNNDINPGLSFLEGQFIAELRPDRIIAGIDGRLSNYMIQAEFLYSSISEINSANNGRGPEWGTALRDSLRLLERQKDKLEWDIRELEGCRSDVMEDGESNRYIQLLSPDTTTFFVFHRSNTAKDANAVISRVEFKNGHEIKELWRTEIDGLFFDPSAASETNAFKEVFSKGSPEFRFSFFGLAGNRLIIVWMLHAQCIDVITGKILWKNRI